MKTERTNVRRHLDRLICLLALLALPVSVAAAAPAKSPPSSTPPVFITSNPIDAVVLIDGKAVRSSRTPMLLRDLRDGKHRIVVARRGYEPYSGSITVAGTKPIVFHAVLDSSSFVLGPQAKVFIGGKSAANEASQYRFPTGQYQVGSSKGNFTINTVFPNQQIMNLVDLTTGALAVVSVIVLGSTILNSSNSNNSNNSNGGNGGAIALWSITGVSALSDVMLHVQKTRFMKDNAPIPMNRSAIDAEQTYNKAQELLVANNLGGAAELYIQIIRDNPESAYYPRALYQLAKIHAIEGDDLLATTELNIILDKYPLPDLYDKTCKSLADISYRKQDYSKAIADLDKMVFLDPLFPRDQIAQYRASIEQKMKQSGAGS